MNGGDIIMATNILDKMRIAMQAKKKMGMMTKPSPTPMMSRNEIKRRTLPGAIGKKGLEVNPFRRA